MLERKKRQSNNSGNTFIVVLVSIACMGILVGVILATVGYYQRYQKIDLENKNNFYYVEKAMDEIYDGIGTDSVGYLFEAYADTVEVMVYYDTTTPGGPTYTTISGEKANQIMKQKFLEKLATSDNYISQVKLYNHLKSFISTPGVQLVDPATLAATEPKLYLEVRMTTNSENVSVYDKIVIHNVTVKRTTAEGYVQSITTDVEITEPQFNVDFSKVNNPSDTLSEFSMIADMGVEFNNTNNVKPNVNIVGNVYAAADYYNKTYNEVPATRVTSNANANIVPEPLNYSGFRVNGANVSVMSEKFIVPGYVTIINDSKLSVMGSSTGSADIWVDNILLTPSATRTVGSKMREGELIMTGDMYVTDDLEINSDNSKVVLSGNYYGYNYSQADAPIQSFTYSSEYHNQGKDHFGSSAIIVNGNNATVDFTGLRNLLVAGRAYIETSRQRVVTTNDDNTIAYTSYKTYENNADVPTGESIAVKSNQLAYMPYGYDEAEKTPIFTRAHDPFNATIKKIIIDDKGWVVADEPVIKRTISDKSYYYLNFTSRGAATEFFNWYANELPNLPGYDLATDIADLTAHGNFNVDGILLNTEGAGATAIATSGAYSSGALNIATDKILKVAAPSDVVSTQGNMITNFNQVAKLRNAQYKEYKATLGYIDLAPYGSNIPSEIANMKSDVEGLKEDEITPINTYLDFSKIGGSGISGVKLNGYYVWISDEDVTVTLPSGASDGIVQGMVIAKGNVTFASDVECFEGLVISGSKIYVDHKMDFFANPTIVTAILNGAYKTKDTADDYSSICEIFKDFEGSSSSEDPSGTKSLANIEIGDVIQYNFWKKNVE